MILEKLGVFGLKEADENLALASLLTGDPLLLIGNHGCAKTHVANKMAQALGRKFLVYDASKCMFEDILGYPNVEKLKHGIVEYVPSPVTVWDKELILVDELNRALAELQSRWLEIIRSRIGRRSSRLDYSIDCSILIRACKPVKVDVLHASSRV